MSQTRQLEEYDTFYSEILDNDDLKQLTDKIIRVAVPFIGKDGQVKVDQLYTAVDAYFSKYSRFAQI